MPLRDLTYVVFDFETTGLYPEDGDEIIEIGAIVIENLQVTEKHYHTLVNPGRPIPAASSAIHGIRDDHVSDSPLISNVIHDFMDFVGGHIWIAQNAKFDLGFVVQKCKQLQMPLRQNVVIDTIGISKMLFPYETSHNLDVMMARLGISRSGDRHRSIDDCKYTAQVFLEFVKLLDQQGIRTLPEIESSFIRAENLLKAEKPKTRNLFN